MYLVEEPEDLPDQVEDLLVLDGPMAEVPILKWLLRFRYTEVGDEVPRLMRVKGHLGGRPSALVDTVSVHNFICE
ncbi:unnamed protein product [Victoria cruziana]